MKWTVGYNSVGCFTNLKFYSLKELNYYAHMQKTSKPSKNIAATHLHKIEKDNTRRHICLGIILMMGVGSNQ